MVFNNCFQLLSFSLSSGKVLFLFDTSVWLLNVTFVQMCLLNITVGGDNLFSGPCTAQRVSRATISDKNRKIRTLYLLIQC